MDRFKLIFSLITLLAVSSYAQPAVTWWQMYDTGRLEGFYDIYDASGDGYIMCGYSRDRNVTRDTTQQILVIRIDDDGDVLWSHEYGEEGVFDEGASIIETDEGNFLIGGRCFPTIAALLIDPNGEEIWYNTYSQAICEAVIELKNGNFALAGYSGGNSYLLCINNEGRLLWEQTYDAWGVENFYTMRETQGGIIASGYASFQVDQRREFRAWIVKAGFDGDQIWARLHAPEHAQIVYSMVSRPEGGFAMGGEFWNGNGGHDILFMAIDDEGELEWYERIDLGGEERAIGMDKLLPNGYVLVGYQGNAVNTELRVGPDGEVRSSRGIPLFEEGNWPLVPNMLESVIRDADNNTVACGMATFDRDGSRQNGLVIKMEPEILEPTIIHYEPEDTRLQVLQGDTIDFVVRAVDQQEDELSYLWIMGEDTLATDTTITVVFEEIGEFEVLCQVSDGEFTSAIAWHINAVEWYIDTFQPESTDLTIRRGSEVDFTHQVRVVEEFEFDYRWEHFGRGGNYEFDGEDSVRINFELQGEHLIRALVMRDDRTESVEWEVNAQSIIWWWWPHEFEIRAPVDTTMEFVIFPFNEESDSLEYSWLLNDEALDGDASVIAIHFPETGQFEISAYVQEGVAADTIRWMVNVEEWSFTADDADLADLPSSPVLYPTSPNPFNSSVRLSLYLPKAGQVSLSVFDINGREVARLVDRNVKAGDQTYVWNASDWSAGVYVVRMDVGDLSEMRKVVLVR